MTFPETVPATAAGGALPDHRIHDLASFNQTIGEGGPIPSAGPGQEIGESNAQA